MANAEKLSNDVLNVVAEQIKERLGNVSPERFFIPLANGAPTPSAELTESFDVWMLGVDNLDSYAQAETDLLNLAKPTGRWHHQIRFDDRGGAFALSKPLGPEASSWSVREISVSPIADDIDKAITLVDDLNLPDDRLVRMLVAPAFHLKAFWIIDKTANTSEVLVISASPSLTHLKLNEKISSKDFLDALLKERPIIGIS